MKNFWLLGDDPQCSASDFNAFLVLSNASSLPAERAIIADNYARKRRNQVKLSSKPISWAPL